MKIDLEAIRENWRHDVAIGSDVPALLAYVEELESRTTYTIGETEWANRIAHAEQRFVEEYDKRKAACRVIDELEQQAQAYRKRLEQCERERDALREEMFGWQHVVEYVLGKDWMHENHGPKEARAELARRAKKNADEHDALLQERDEERMRTRCFEQAMAEAQADSVDHLFRRLRGTVCAFKVGEGELVMVPGEEVARCLARFLCLIELA